MMEPLMAAILLAALFLGILVKTWIPYAGKLKEKKIVEFDPRYMWTAIASFVGAFATAWEMFSEAAAQWPVEWPFGAGYASIALFGFVWAMGWNFGLNLAFKPKPTE